VCRVVAQAAPEGPTALAKSSYRQVLRRTFREFRDDRLLDWAAALTYYGVLSIFPAMLALVSIIGLIGPSATGPLLHNLEQLTPGPGREIVTDIVRNLEQNESHAGFFTFVGIATAMWSASAYVGAFMRASNAVFDMPEGRPVWKTLPIRLAVTAGLMIVLAVTVFAVVVTGALAERAGALVGAGEGAIAVWDVAKWPVLVVVVTLTLAVLYWAAPNVKQQDFRWITPGAVLAVALWVVASLGFALYATHFGSYDKAYGALAGVVVFLVWLWLTNIVTLLGLELNAELERERSILSGGSAADMEYVEPRDTQAFPDEADGPGQAAAAADR
jgi:membrane protein